MAHSNLLLKSSLRKFLRKCEKKVDEKKVREYILNNKTTSDVHDRIPGNNALKQYSGKFDKYIDRRGILREFLTNFVL